MKSVNKVILLGNVTRDPELKSTGSGQSVCTFGLATNRVWKDASGEKQSLPEYHNLVCWGGLAEFAAQNVRKGKPLYIEGYLKTRSWDSPEGSKIFRTEIVLDNLILLGARDANGNGQHSPFEQSVEHAVAIAEETLPSTHEMVLDAMTDDL